MSSFCFIIVFKNHFNNLDNNCRYNCKSEDRQNLISTDILNAEQSMKRRNKQYQWEKQYAKYKSAYAVDVRGKTCFENRTFGAAVETVEQSCKR